MQILPGHAASQRIMRNKRTSTPAPISRGCKHTEPCALISSVAGSQDTGLLLWQMPSCRTATTTRCTGGFASRIHSPAKLYCSANCFCDIAGTRLACHPRHMLQKLSENSLAHFFAPNCWSCLHLQRCFKVLRLGLLITKVQEALFLATLETLP